MLLAELLAASERVAATRSRLAKIDALAECLRRLDASEIALGVAYLSGDTRQGRIGIGYAALEDVEKKKKTDRMESFFLAETLKYLYLLFAPRETLDLNKVVFNTEAHPLRRTW